MRFLILNTTPNGEVTKRLAHEAFKRGHQVLAANPADLFLLISNSESGYDRLYIVDGKKTSRIAIKDCDVVIPRIGENTTYGAFVVEHLNHNLGIFTTASAEGIRSASNQLMTLQQLSSYGLPTPRTVYANNSKHIEHLIGKVGSYPIVIKLLHGSGGLGVTMHRDRSTAIPMLQSLFKSKSNVLIQEYLESGGSDYRAIVVGEQVVASFKRTANKKDFRANLKQGGQGTPIKLNQEDQDLCIHAANAVNLKVVGIDLIKTSGRTYIVEANANFGYRVEAITGINVALETIKFCEINYRIKDPEKSRASALQGLLLEERLKSEKKTSQLHALNRNFGGFANDRYLREVFEKSKGKRITYLDRNQKRKQLIVHSSKDLYQIMLESFSVK